MSRTWRGLVTAGIAVGALALPAPSQAVGAGAVGCLVTGQTAAASMSFVMTCDGPSAGVLAYFFEGTLTWSGAIDDLSGTPGSVSLTGAFLDLAGPCTARRFATARHYQFECSTTDGERDVVARWAVTEYRDGAVVGNAGMWYADTAGGPPQGRACSFDTTDGLVVWPEDGRWTGTLRGGPLAVPGSDVSIRCSLRSTYQNSHAAPALVSASAGPRRDVAELPPQQVSVVLADELDFPVTCTEATVDGTAWYLADEWGYRYWTRDPSRRCQQVTSEGYFTSTDLVVAHALGWALDELWPPPLATPSSRNSAPLSAA